MATMQQVASVSGSPPAPDPEVPERARNRTFSPRYKLDVLNQYESLNKQDKGALLRREGLYTSLISEWRKQRDKGALEALSPPRGRPPADPLERENERLRRENERLQRELAKARKVMRVQGTLRALGGARVRERGSDQRADQMIDEAIVELAQVVGTTAACAAVGRARATHYRLHRKSPPRPRPAPKPPRPQPRATSSGALRASLATVSSRWGAARDEFQRR